MNKKIFLFAVLCAWTAGCSSEAIIGSEDKCNCSSDQVCVNNTCYSSDSPCASCSSHQVCFNEACYDEDSACAKCKKGQVCVDDKCTDKSEHGQDKVCINGTCYEAGHPCTKCIEDQVCKKDKCYDADDPCLKCNDDEVCTDGACQKPDNPCDACAPSDTCDETGCIPCKNAVCGEICCQEGEICNAFGNDCTFPCEDGRPMCESECCTQDMFCSEKGYCDRQCEFGSSCGESRVCCAEDQTCLNDDHCVPKCESPRILCGESSKEVCCAEGQVCLNNECRVACSAETTRCGKDQNLCCDNATQICIFNTCAPKGAPCTKNEDCELSEFCDIGGTQTCVSQDINPGTCTYHPEFAAFEPKVKWHFKDREVCGTPAAADLTGDGVPEVVFQTYNYEVIALDGDTGQVQAIANPSNTGRQFHPWGDLALADIDNDKLVEAIVPTGESKPNSSGLSILNLVKDGDKWTWKEKAFIKIDDSLLASNYTNGVYYADIHPAVADIDGDKIPEIVTAVGVVKGSDLTKWQCQLNLPSYYAWYRYGIVIADLDQDGQSELIADKIYNNKCEVIADAVEGGWGFPAVADMQPSTGESGELVPEVIRVNANSVSVWKVYKNGTAWSQKKMWATAHPGGGGGHPNIADFNGDKKAEIGIAGSDYYAVFSGDGAILWQSKTQDHSSHRTGSSVFDFEGDGKAEVVYRDECYLRVYNGSDGKVIMEQPVTSTTVIDYPLIVDVDADGKTEIITTSDTNNCPHGITNTRGVISYEDSHSRWVRTRKIWNQHAYHVTNINEDGSVPSPEAANWLNKRLNNYRANTQPDDAFNAPNLTAGDLKIEQQCPNIKLTATIKNDGSASAKDIWVSFYIRGYKTQAGTEDLFIGSVRSKGYIAPGASMDVSYEWHLDGKLITSGTAVNNIVLPQNVSFVVDSAPGQNTADFYNECKEDDNESKATHVEPCPVN